MTTRHSLDGPYSRENPHYGQAYELVAHFFIINRRYEEGIAITARRSTISRISGARARSSASI